LSCRLTTQIPITPTLLEQVRGILFPYLTRTLFSNGEEEKKTFFGRWHEFLVQAMKSFVTLLKEHLNTEEKKFLFKLIIKLNVCEVIKDFREATEELEFYLEELDDMEKLAVLVALQDHHENNYLRERILMSMLMDENKNFEVRAKAIEVLVSDNNLERIKNEFLVPSFAKRDPSPATVVLCSEIFYTELMNCTTWSLPSGFVALHVSQITALMKKVFEEGITTSMDWELAGQVLSNGVYFCNRYSYPEISKLLYIIAIRRTKGRLLFFYSDKANLESIRQSHQWFQTSGLRPLRRAPLQPMKKQVTSLKELAAIETLASNSFNSKTARLPTELKVIHHSYFDFLKHPM
jgi:hypothetical protein